MKLSLTRRGFLRQSSMGFGMLAFAGLSSRWAGADVARALPHFAPRARHVIFLFMDGGVSHVDTRHRFGTVDRHRRKRMTHRE